MILDLYNVGQRSRSIVFQITLATGNEARAFGPIGTPYLIDSIALSGLGGVNNFYNYNLFVGNSPDVTVVNNTVEGDPVYRYRGNGIPSIIAAPLARHDYSHTTYPRFPVYRAPTYLKLYIRSTNLNHSISCIVNILPPRGAI